MKKIFYSVLAASMLFACSQEEIVDVTKGEGQQVTFKVELPSVGQSRAIAPGVEVGAGKYADKLIYAMYEEDQNEILVAGVKSEVTEGTFEVNVPMAKDIKYDILFLAYNPGNNIFGISADIDTEEEAKTIDLKNLTLKQELLANQEAYDAFIGRLDSKGVDAAAKTTVELYRPFAQVNAAATETDMQNADILNAEVAKSYIKVYNAPTKLNVFTGTVSEPQTFEYKLADILNKDGQNEYPNETLVVENNTYYYLAMAYVLAGESSSTCNADFSFYRADNKLVSSLEVKYMPIQANYRTNVLGNLLTQVEDYEIKIDAAFGEPDHNDMTVVQKAVVANESDLVEAIQAIANDTQNSPEKTLYVIEMNGDITFGGNSSSTYSRAAAADCITIPAGKSVKIDLKGYNITGTDNATGSFGLINLAAGSNLSIINSDETKGGNITLEAMNDRDWNAYSSVISNQRATLTVGANVVVEHKGGTDMAYGIDNLTNTGAEHAKTTIEGATIKSTYRAIRQFLNSSATGVNNELYVMSGTIEGKDKTIWMQDANTSANPGKLIVSAEAALKGHVYLSVAAGSTEWPVEVSIAAAALKDTTQVLSTNVPYDYKVVENDGVWTVQLKDAVAKIGERGFTTLQKAVNAVQDGETITLIADEIFTEKNYYDNGGYKDGIGYSGDKSFTIDLNGKKISQDGALNDYLIWIKNVGSKENVITIKNGTLDAGTTAYCALCTASSHENQLTVNLENVTLYNQKSNGSTVKIRAGSVLNVNAGTKITGKDSYLGIENWNATVNIYDGAEIYMNGTSSYNGCLVGVGGNGTINVSGGYGKGVSGGLIAMTSGGTINVSGGEWIANTDGTFANNNKSVLIAQSDKQYNAGAGNAVVNVTGGTFKGGYNCYGNAVGDAQINISGGNFNNNPTTYLSDGCEAIEANGIWTVKELPAAKIGETGYETLEAAVAEAQAGDEITLSKDITLSAELALPAGIIFNGNSKQINGTIYAGGDLTFVGHTKVTSFSASYYDRTITIGEGACLEVTGTGRVTLGYGNTFNITGSIENAKTADKASVTPSLIIPGGISITGGNDAALNVTNAYVQIGSTTSKPGVANGKFTLNFDNSIVEFTKEFGFYEPTSGMNPTFEMNIENSVFTTGTKLCVAATNSTVVVDNSVVTLATYLRNSGGIKLKNGSVLTGKTIQFGESGGNNGTITVDASELTIEAGSTGNAFDGKGVGSITLTNGAKANIDYYKDMTINVDETSQFETLVK